MGLATTYIVAKFAIFVSLLSFILSSYGGQVSIRSSSHPKDGDMEDMGLATTYIVAMFAIFVSLLSFILSSYGGQVTTSSSSSRIVRRIGFICAAELYSRLINIYT
jgi:hypothetical protein